MYPDRDFSSAYVILKTDHPKGLEGHGLLFTIGRGNEVCVAPINAFASHVNDKTLESFTQNVGDFWRSLTGDIQLRWIGPEKGAIHLGKAWTS
jgi:L-fuconate dehydratase